ncbi:MAG TPA: thermonuclease family protein [Candidatus Obscuribacterales bacterium]
MSCVYRWRYGWVGAIALVVLLFTGLGGTTLAARPTATIAYAKSGHTLAVLAALSPDLPASAIRLEGIQAPDLQQVPWGEAARDCLAPLREAVVALETEDWSADQYDRLWAYVWAGKQLVNRDLLAQGCAYLAGDRLAQGQHHTALLYAQESARLLGLGIWNPAQPLRETPETFRRRSPTP